MGKIFGLLLRKTERRIYKIEEVLEIRNECGKRRLNVAYGGGKRSRMGKLWKPGQEFKRF